MSTFAEKLAKAKLPRRTVEICLAGDLVAEFENLERQLDEAARRPASDSIEDDGGVTAIAEQMEALRQQMREDSHTFVVQALPRPAYQRLKDEHPPRESEDGEIRREDVILDANYDTFLTPLLRASLVDPVLDDATWADLESKISDSQFNALVNAAVTVNKGGLSVPFSRAASAILSSSGSE